MWNVLIELNGVVLAAYLSDYGDAEEVLPARSAAGTGHGDYIINMCLNREGFQAISHIRTYKDQNMMVVVERRRSLCWAGKQLGHFARSCPQKTLNPQQQEQQQQQQPRQPQQASQIWSLGTIPTKKNGGLR